MSSRRTFLGALGMAPFAACASLRPEQLGDTIGFLRAAQDDGRDPDVVARDEAYWREAQLAFAVDRSIVNLNNGGVSPSPAIVQQKLHELQDFGNNAPPWHMWRVLEPNREGVRQQLAQMLGCDAEEVAITRNASESLMTCQHGIDLQPGDEVLTTDQDYPRMLQAFEQRVRRHGVVLKKIALPVPCEDDAEVVSRFAAAITGRTRLILVCHVINLTGQILPVRAVAALGRERGIPVVVDGAHAVAHFPFRLDELEIDYYGSSLHKWLFAPVGNGLLYVRRERIAGLWPLFAADPKLDQDIRKFEEIGTHPAAPALAIAVALTFHQALGPARKLARLRYLRDRWATRLLERDLVRLHTSLKPGFAGGIATVQVEGVEPAKLSAHLWDRHRILVTPIVHAQFQGIRVSPSVYTTLAEIDRFSDAMERVLRDPTALV